MVNFGSIIGLLLAGGVAIGAYAVYQNRGSIGAALSRGVAVNVSNPIGDYFENLFRNNEGAGEGEENPPEAPGPAGPPPVIPHNDPGPIDEHPPNEPNRNNDYVPDSNNPADERTFEDDYVPPPEQDFLPRTSETSAIRLANFNQNSRQEVLDRAQEISEDRGLDIGNSVDTAILEAAGPNTRFYDIYQDGELKFNEYPLNQEAREYYLNLGYSVRTADGV